MVVPCQKRTLGDQEEQDRILEPARQALKRTGIEEGSPEELERQALWAQIVQRFEKGEARNRAREFVNTLMHGTDLPVGGSVDMWSDEAHDYQKYYRRALGRLY
jgi:hypothetical protein